MQWMNPIDGLHRAILCRRSLYYLHTIIPNVYSISTSIGTPGLSCCNLMCYNAIPIIDLERKGSRSSNLVIPSSISQSMLL